MEPLRLSPTLLQCLGQPGPVVVISGAGVSAESGLATFRDPGGLWEQHSPIDLASNDAFLRDPELVWRFYSWRRERARMAEPNAAHRAIVEIESLYDDFLLVTQNVDGLHERAGSRRVLRLHGSLWTTRCTREGTELADDRVEFTSLPPRCDCGALLRPAVVWFGETLPAGALERATVAARHARLLLVVGTSGTVWPAAGLVHQAAQAGAYVVEINPEATALSPVADESILAPAVAAMSAIARAAGAARRGAA